MKTYVLDASAVLALLEGKPAAMKVKEILQEAMRDRAVVLMSAVNYGEAYGTVLRLYGQDRALATMSAVQPLPIQIVPADTQRCCRAAEIKIRYKLYYADSFAAELALDGKATLVTSDSDFRRMGHGFPILWLKA
jgi:predicted nucleic acid-binding protein